MRLNCPVCPFDLHRDPRLRISNHAPRAIACANSSRKFSTRAVRLRRECCTKSRRVHWQSYFYACENRPGQALAVRAGFQRGCNIRGSGLRAHGLKFRWRHGFRDTKLCPHSSRWVAYEFTRRCLQRPLQLADGPPLPGNSWSGLFQASRDCGRLSQANRAALRSRHLHIFRYRESFPATFVGTAPLIRAKFEVPGHRSMEASFEVNTALDAAIVFSSAYTDAHRFSSWHFKTIAVSYPQLDAGAKIFLGRLKTFQLGPYTVQEPVAAFSQSNPVRRRHELWPARSAPISSPLQRTLIFLINA